MHRIIGGLPAVAAAMVAAAGLSLATSATAGASVNGHVSYTTTTAGYQVNSAQDFNDVRATVTFPFITGATSQVDLLLQHASGAGPTAQLSLTYNGGRSNEWTLKWGYSATSTAPALQTVIPLTEVTNDPTYVEIYYSTSSHQIVFLTGTEGHTVVVHRVTGVHGQFSAPAVEVASLYQSASTLPVGAQQASFTRVGVTELLSPRNPSSPTRRLTFSAVSLDTIEATASGKPPTSASPLSLVPYPLGAGSAFPVVAVG
jgi:hypothetical protein